MLLLNRDHKGFMRVLEGVKEGVREVLGDGSKGGLAPVHRCWHAGHICSSLAEGKRGLGLGWVKW